MICRNCGKPINDTATYCGYCNAIVKPEQIIAQKTKSAYQQIPQQPIIYQHPAPQPPKEEKASFYKKWWFWTVIVLIILLIIGIIFFVTNSKENNDDKKVDSKTTTQAVTVTVPEVISIPSATKPVTDPVTDPVTEGIHDGSFDSFDDGYNYDDDNDYTFIDIDMNKTVQVENLVSFTIIDAAFTDEFTSTLPDIANETYIVIIAQVINMSPAEINHNNFHAEFIIDDAYVYEDSAKVYTSDDELENLKTYGTLSSGDGQYVAFVCSIPDEIYNICESVNLIIGFDNEFSYNPTVYGKDSCDHLYSLYLETE